MVFPILLAGIAHLSIVTDVVFADQSNHRHFSVQRCFIRCNCYKSAYCVGVRRFIFCCMAVDGVHVGSVRKPATGNRHQSVRQVVHLLMRAQYGKVSDIYGRRKCLVFCWTVFGLGCLLVYLRKIFDLRMSLTIARGVGQTYWQIILGRAISGIGSAGKIALTSIVVAGERRSYII